MSYAAAFIIHTIPTLTGLDMFSWWTISDVFEEGWLSGIPFYGGYGLLTSQGVAKPACKKTRKFNTVSPFPDRYVGFIIVRLNLRVFSDRAFQMLNTAGDQRLAVAVTGQASENVPITVFATTHSGGSRVGAKGPCANLVASLT